MLCNANLTVQLTMIPGKTNYITNGPGGVPRLAEGPTLPSYRGLSMMKMRKFSMEAEATSRDLLCRRVRVCQHCHIPWNDGACLTRIYEPYDESKQRPKTRLP